MFFSRAFQDRLVNGGSLGASSRLELWRATWEGLLHSPVSGLGLGGTRYAINQYAQIPLTSEPIHAHNDYLEWIADLGLPAALGAIVLVICFLVSWGRSWSAADKHSEMAMIRRAATAGLCIVLAHSLVDFPLRVPVIGLVCLTLLALAFPRRLRHLS
jgi:O-antigen ligase